jgi:hypothetical protein
MSEAELNKFKRTKTVGTSLTDAKGNYRLFARSGGFTSFE